MKTSIVNHVETLADIKAISPKKLGNAVSTAVKDGEKMMAAGQDAAAVQGKAMVKPYQKPETTVIFINKENLRTSSASGWNTGGKNDYDPNLQNFNDEDWSSVKRAVDWDNPW